MTAKSDEIRMTTKTQGALRLATLVLVACVSVTTAAQDGAARVRQLNERAVNSYHELEIERAQQYLYDALTVAERGHVTGPDLGRTFILLGVVAVGGQQDRNRGVQYFMQALEADPAARVDPSLSSPDVLSAFNVAQSRVAGGGRSGGAAATTATTGSSARGGAAAGGAAATATAASGGAATTASGAAGTTGSGSAPEATSEERTETSSGTRLVGDPCSETSECSSGLSCEEGVCTPPPSEPTEPLRPPRFFFHAGYSVGAGYASQHMLADSTIPYDPRFQPSSWNNTINGSYAPPGYTQDEWLQAIEALYGGYAPSANGPGDIGTLTTDPDCDVAADQYCVRLKSPGFLPINGLRYEFGYFFTERFGASVDMRVAGHAGLGTLSRLLFSFRALYHLTEPRATGFHSHAFAGFSVGQIQMRPKQGTYSGSPITSSNPYSGPVVLVDTGDELKRPFIQTGLYGVQAGALFGYRFEEHFGLFVQPTLYFLFPHSSFMFDATMGVEITF